MSLPASLGHSPRALPVARLYEIAAMEDELAAIRVVLDAYGMRPGDGIPLTPSMLRLKTDAQAVGTLRGMEDPRVGAAEARVAVEALLEARRVAHLLADAWEHDRDALQALRERSAS